MRPFRELVVWRKAHRLTLELYKIARIGLRQRARIPHFARGGSRLLDRRISFRHARLRGRRKTDAQWAVASVNRRWQRLFKLGRLTADGRWLTAPTNLGNPSTVEGVEPCIHPILRS